MALFDESIFQLIYQDLYSIPSHAFALVMEIKVDVVNISIIQLCYNVFKCLLDW